VLVASHIVVAAQSIVARNVNPLENAVLSITKPASGTTDKVIPDEAVMLGTARSYLPHVQDMLESHLGRMVQNVSAALRS
jgi:metal-dependent amidase/aminoacylase/carboxypeptidase family protein